MDILPEDVEIVSLSIAYRSGFYYYKQAESRITLIWECYIKIEPFIAVEHKKVFDLSDFITDKKITDKLSKKRSKDFENIQDKAKDTNENRLNNIAASISITGGISVESIIFK